VPLFVIGFVHVPLLRWANDKQGLQEYLQHPRSMVASVHHEQREEVSRINHQESVSQPPLPQQYPLAFPVQRNFSNQCYNWRGTLSPREIVEHVLPQPPPRGIMVTLLLGQNALDYLCRFFPSQWQHLIQPQGWDVLFVIGTIAKDPRSQQQASMLKEQLKSCLYLKQLQGAQHLQPQEWYNLDGSTMTTQAYQIVPPNLTRTTPQHDTNLIFLAESELGLPRYIQANESLLKLPMEPRHCQAPLPYVLGTKWYVHEMLHLSILQQYDYFIKLDTDVVFLKPLPLHLLHDMTIRRSVFGHTGQYPDHVTAPCGRGIGQAVSDFLHEQQQPNSGSNVLCSRDHPALRKDADLYYTNFIIGRTDFFQSPLVLQFARFLAEYPMGYFRYRWTDQIWFHFAMGLQIADNFEQAVVDYSEFRCAPHKNCWMTVHYYNHDRCDNGGVFFHTKAKRAPFKNSSEWTWKEEFVDGISLVANGRNLERSTVPYKTLYVDRCK
jgi:hypothetical protein